MNGIGKTIGFELKKISHNKLMIAILAVLLAAALAVPTVKYFCFSKPQPLEIEDDRTAVLMGYREELERYEQLQIRYADTLTKKEKEIYDDICARLLFFIETGTTESDYQNLSSLTEKYETKENTGFMFFFGTVSSFLLWALAIATAAYLFVFEYHTSTLKNVLASQISRDKIFAGKLLFMLLFLTAVFLIFTLYAFAFGLTQSQLLLILHNGDYRAIGTATAFISQSVAVYVIMLILSAVTALSGIAFRNIAVGIATPGALYGITILMYAAIADATRKNPAYSQINYIDKIPLLSIQFHIGGFDWSFILSLLLHLASAVLLMLLCFRKFKKQDV